MAETLMAEQADRRDTLRLLALVASHLGAKGLGNYEPPSAALEQALREPPPDPAQRRREIRALGDLEEVG